MAKKMTLVQIKHTKPSEYEGRNGAGKSVGTELFFHDGTHCVWLAAINSKNRPARGHIEVPLDDIPKLVTVLQKFYKQHKKLVGQPTPYQKFLALNPEQA